MTTPLGPFDLSDYSTLPRFNVERAVALAQALLAAAPSKGLTRISRRALKRLEEAHGALVEAWQPGLQKPASDRRPADRAIDNAWNAIYHRLSAWSQLTLETPEVTDQAARAAVLVNVLFPTGLDFLKLPYDREWAQSERRVTLIDDPDDDLNGDLVALTGVEFLTNLRAAHLRYGEALGITAPSEPAPTPKVSLNEPLRALRLVMVDWALRLISTTDDEDPDAVEITRAALLPIDGLRVAAVKGSAGRADSHTEDPAPPEA